MSSAVHEVNIVGAERGCVADQPQQFERAAADALREAALPQRR